MDSSFFRDYLNPFGGGAKLKGRIVTDSIAILKKEDGKDEVGDDANTRNTTTAKLDFCVYLPPSYNNGQINNKNNNFPILYHLHGAGEMFYMMKKEVSWIGAQLEQANVEMIVAAPYDPTKFSMWADGDNIDMANRIHRHFIPHVETTYYDNDNDTSSSSESPPHRRRRFIQGFSMGGFGAALHAFKCNEQQEPEFFFEKIILWDGALHNWQTLSTNRPFIAKAQFQDDESNFQPWCPHDAVRNASPQTIQQTPIRMYTGKMKETRAFAKTYKQALDEKDVDYVHTECDDLSHNLKLFLDRYGQEAIQFLLN